MEGFRFLHAADLHLDSPLIGLARKSQDLASRVEDASRGAFDNLVSLAIQEECRFVLLCGDLFDGQWRDYRTGLFFADRLRRLEQAGVEAFVILGNHDAENRFASRLELSPNVHKFPTHKPDTIPVKGLDAVVHGRSFPQRDVFENIAKDYLAPIPGCFNIGLLHTSCMGRDGYEPYAPCTVEQLVNHGYDYWALGHIHAQEVLHQSPHIVYPGNLQGRSFRETGPKGASLVTVEDGRVVNLEHRALDVIRWSIVSIDIGACPDLTSVHGAVRAEMVRATDLADGRGLVLRVRLLGTTPIHDEVVVELARLREDIETIAATISDELWIETVEVSTIPPHRPETTDPTIAGRIRSLVEEFIDEPAIREVLETKLREVSEKMPAAAHADELWKSIRSEEPARARKLALSLIESRGE